jgi:hypothetical protein
LLTYQRCDGIVIGNESILRACGNDPRGAWDGKEPYEDAMARIDAAHPLPAPEPMPGQVWRDSIDEWLVTTVGHLGKTIWTVSTPIPGAPVIRKFTTDPEKWTTAEP